MLSDADLRLIDDLLERHRQPAILLHLPYPPHSAPKGRSKVGGKPNLPMDYEWPIGKYLGNSMPLHFYAQINCEELPFIYGRLPSKGMLFFFGCDIEQCFGSFAPQDDSRVIYIEDLPTDTPLREPPAELPPILERNAEPDIIVSNGGLPGEAGPNLHVEWPLVARTIETWPERAAFYRAGIFTSDIAPDDITRAYDARLQFKRLDAFAAVTGAGNMSGGVTSMPRASAFFGFIEPPEFDGRRFPQFAIMIDRTTRHVLKGAKDAIRQPHFRRDDMQRHLQSIIDTSMKWSKRARDIGPFNHPSAADAKEFSSWLNEIAIRFPSEMPPYVSIDPHPHVHAALVDTINAMAHQHPERISNIYYKAVAEKFTPYSSFSSGSLWYAPLFHQMLGHAQSCQMPQFIGEDTVCLLQLRSDYVRQMPFGDSGECTFWIKPADLAARRFDKAWATITST